MSRRPSGLSAVCIIGLILGGLGSLMWCFGGFSLVMQLAGTNPFAPDPAALPPEMQGPQAEMLREAEALGQKYMVVNTLIWAWQLVTLVLLFVGCIAGLRMTPRALVWLKRAMINGLAFELVRAVPTIAMQLETVGMMERMMQGMGGGRPGAAPPPGMKTFLVAFSLGFAALLILAKLGYYGWGLWYVSRENVQNWFGTPEDESLDEYDKPAAK
jgi:hypothetical protein